jgi:hypothetical protein
MNFFTKLLNSLKGAPPSGSDRYLPVYVFSNRCRELIAGQVDLMNETSLDDESKGGYYVRKVLHTSGKDRCFGQVEIELWLDSNKRVVRHEVQGGRWLTAEEYAAEKAGQEEEETGDQRSEIGDQRSETDEQNTETRD